VADAAALGRDIKSAGHVAVYGINFDTNKALVRPDSKPALDEIAKLLKADPALELKVVGHTDMVGTVEANMALSQARAEAVVQALVGQYGVAAARLKGYGVGPLAPVASNDNDEGRAKNRRVELVKE
jgi:outer membrane protein OmpA-like peptidoglycan-associated protein